MNTQQYADYKVTVRNFLRSNNVKPGCFGAVNPDSSDLTFSNRPCECCQRPLADNREQYNFATVNGAKFTAEICSDCQYFLEYGTLDDQTMVEWTANLWALAKENCNRVAMENPKNVMGAKIGKRTQTIQPFEFGHMERKETWLWLHNLPLLVSTNNVFNAMMELPKHERERIFFMGPSDVRARDRSVTYSGIAKAMATQWDTL